eukprot:Clim_evm26s44 gene=Clim_evmTU26s44
MMSRSGQSLKQILLFARKWGSSTLMMMTPQETTGKSKCETVDEKTCEDDDDEVQNESVIEEEKISDMDPLKRDIYECQCIRAVHSSYREHCQYHHPSRHGPCFWVSMLCFSCARNLKALEDFDDIHTQNRDLHITLDDAQRNVDVTSMTEAAAPGGHGAERRALIKKVKHQKQSIAALRYEIAMFSTKAGLPPLPATQKTASTR